MNCTIVIFSRCDSVTLKNTVLSERSLHVCDPECLHSETGCCMVYTEIGKLACSWKTSKKVWSNFPSYQRYLPEGGEGGGHQRFLSHVAAGCCSDGGPARWVPARLAWGQGSAWGLGVSHQLWADWTGCVVGGHPDTSQLLISPLNLITSTVLKKNPPFFYYRSC